MTKIKNLPVVYATVIAGLVIIILGAILISTVRYNQDKDSAKVSPAPSSSPTVSPSPTDPVVVPVASSSPSPVISASPSTSASFPQSAKTFLANFYAAYNQSDKTRLATYFTPDTLKEDLYEHAHLFNGTDPDGTNPGGPTLFETSSASQRTTGYVTTATASQQNNWVVTVQEQRVDGNGVSISPITTLLTLAPSTNPTGSWLIDRYIRSGGTGKYSAFLNQ